jgi:hypothetical protein
MSLSVIPATRSGSRLAGHTCFLMWPCHQRMGQDVACSAVEDIIAFFAKKRVEPLCRKNPTWPTTKNGISSPQAHRHITRAPRGLITILEEAEMNAWLLLFEGTGWLLWARDGSSIGFWVALHVYILAQEFLFCFLTSAIQPTFSMCVSVLYLTQKMGGLALFQSPKRQRERRHVSQFVDKAKPRLTTIAALFRFVRN